MFTILVLLPVCLSANADHTVSFSYDSAGNRIYQSVTSPVSAPSNRLSPANATTEISLNNEENVDICLHVSPNPTKGLLCIELKNLPEGEFYRYVIVGSGGTIVCNEETTQNPLQTDLSACPSGIYMLKIYCTDTEKEFKIIKK